MACRVLNLNMAEPDALLAGRLEGDQEKVLLIHQGRTYTRGELAGHADRLAAELSANLRSGDMLAIWLPNSPQLLILYLACFQRGIVPMPLNPGLKLPELTQLLRHSGARGLITTPEMGVAHARLFTTLVRRVWTVSRMDMLLRDTSDPACGEASGDSSSVSNNASERPVLVLNTSGSSGLPKAVVLSYRAVHHNLTYRLAYCELTDTSISVVASCMAQSVGLYQCLALLGAGAMTVLLQSYDIPQLIESINHYRPTHLIMVVSAFDLLLHDTRITSESLQCVRFAAAGADCVTPRVQQRFIALTNRTLRSSYGLCESSWALVNDGKHADTGLALGKPCPDVEIRLLRSNGSNVSVGEVGQIYIKSRRNMLGYLNDEITTDAALVDGWLATGDLAYEDNDGYFWFAGRSKDLIILSSGDNVSPTEVENVLCSHPAVSACMVVKRPTAAGSEVPWALVVSKRPVSTQTLRDFMHQRLSDFKVPEGIEFVTELPVGLSGKIQRSTQ